MTAKASCRDTVTLSYHRTVEPIEQYTFYPVVEVEGNYFIDRREMTNHLCAPPSQNDCSNQVVMIELPNGSTAKILVGNANCATIRDLKLGCELQFGIPCNLQRVSALENPELELSDWILLKDTVQTIDDVIVVQVPVWWNKFICVSMNNEIENVCRRAKLPMQQISKEERLFVGFFIACCCGHENLLEKLSTLDIHFDQQAATESGRNLFHAAAASGKVNCLEFVAKHLVKPSKEILSKLDTNGETPIDITRRFNYQDVERLLYKLLFYEKGEREQRNSDESGIDVCDSVDSDDSLEGTKPRHDNTDQEEALKDRENNHPGIPKNGFEDGELVITECDEGDSFAIDVKKELKKCPSNSSKSKDGVCQQDGLSNSGTRGDQMPATSPFSSDSFDDSLKLSPRLNRPQTLDLSPKQRLLRRRFVNEDPSGRPKSARTVQYPQINVYQEEDEEVGPDENHLPPLENQTLVSQNASNAFSKRMKQTVVRTISNSHSSALKERLIPSPDEEPRTSKSAPGSPQTLRRMVFKPSSKPPSSPGSIRVCPLSPNMSRVLDQRRGSEPVACLNRTNGIRLGRARRDAVISTDLTHGDSHVSAMPSSPKMHKRGKARSICEVSLTDSLRCRTDMEDEERLDRPWNAWIAVRKESLQLVNKDSASPTNPRRMSYQQWLSEKELAHLRRIFANAQEEAKTNEKQAKLLKGKTFDEWVEDKRREMEKEKEKEKGMEENQKQEEDKKQQRRRMSQVKYEKWLMQKERNALQQAEKMVQLAKEKHELMKKKWEEEDEQKKNYKLSLGRTHSLPVEGNPRPAGINKNRFTSLK